MPYSSLVRFEPCSTRLAKGKRKQFKITGSDVSSMPLTGKPCKNLFHQPKLSRCNMDQYTSSLYF